MDQTGDKVDGMQPSEEFTPNDAQVGSGFRFVRLATLALGVSAAGFVYANQGKYMDAYANLFAGSDFGPTCASTKGTFAGSGCCESQAAMTVASGGCCSDSGMAVAGCSASSCGGAADEPAEVLAATDFAAPFLETPLAL
ncbi:MAG: hypothetical protein AAGJ97_11150 [Planctomycetota bacterium]